MSKLGRPNLALRSILTFGLAWGCSHAFAKAPRAQPDNAPLIWDQPDVFGGYVSDAILVRVQPDVTPIHLPDGRWTFIAAQEAGQDKQLVPGLDEHSEALAAASQRWEVIAIAPALSVKPANMALAQQLGLDRYYRLGVPVGTNAPAMAAEFSAFDQLLEIAIVDVIGGIASIPNDASFSSQWNMHNTGQSSGTPDADIDAPECWDIYQGSAETIVAVLDTGVQVDHPDLIGRVTLGPDFYTCPAPDPPDCDIPGSYDIHGHGTHCTGTLAANANNAQGIAGLNWNCQILAVRVVHAQTGAGSASNCADGVIWAADNGADIISMSLQFFNLAPGHPLEAAVAYAYDSGTLPIGATGNGSNPNNVAYPAKYDKCMAIGATDRNDVRWPSSNGGPQIDLVAPGKDIYSLWKNSGYSTQPGTSMAVPHVSGVASLMRGHYPALTNQQIEEILHATVEDKGAAGFDNLYGWGRLNARAALQAAIAAACPGNTNGDGTVDVNDLLAVVNAWGSCANCPADIAPLGGDDAINVNDLLAVINGWGACE